MSRTSSPTWTRPWPRSAHRLAVSVHFPRNIVAWGSGPNAEARRRREEHGERWTCPPWMNSPNPLREPPLSPVPRCVFWPPFCTTIGRCSNSSRRSAKNHLFERCLIDACQWTGIGRSSRKGHSRRTAEAPGGEQYTPVRGRLNVRNLPWYGSLREDIPNRAWLSCEDSKVVAERRELTEGLVTPSIDNQDFGNGKEGVSSIQYKPASPRQ